jgi:hypothetical protein
MIPVKGDRDDGCCGRTEIGCLTTTPRTSYSCSKHRMYDRIPASRLSRQAKREAGSGLASQESAGEDSHWQGWRSVHGVMTI